jgi:predicted acylesterase/phospholipase RssA
MDLALQGGGAHGAFTWGVLDRLLEEPWLKIDGISGTSAGAMNAAVLIDGHATSGADGARAALERFWRSVSEAALLSPLRRTPLDVLLGRWTLDYSPAFIAMDLASRLFSPYDLNPVERPGTPRTARDILNRLNEISFNAVTLKELRMIALLRRVADPGNSEGALWAAMRVHLISSPLMTELGYSSKLNAEWDFLCMLRDEGRRVADAFLRAHRADLGQRSTVQLDRLLEGV